MFLLSQTKFPLSATQPVSTTEVLHRHCEGTFPFWVSNVLLQILSNFSVPSGFEGIKEQEICNKIMTKMLESYNTLFELEGLKKDEEKPVCEELARIILVKVSISNTVLSYSKSVVQVHGCFNSEVC